MIKNNIMRYGRYLIRQQKKEQLEKILQIADFSKENNIVPKKIEKILFVVPYLGSNSGGGSSILRIGTYLASKGLNVKYVCYDSNDIDVLSQNAEKNVHGYKGEYIRYNDAINLNFDICIATCWQSVYYSRPLSGYKIYFVQDYEPFFYEMSDEYKMAEKTYSLGYHIISLGHWNLKQIIKNIGEVEKMDFISFPYEPSEYKELNRDYSSYSSKKSFSMCVYIKSSGRRIPRIIQYLLKEVEIEMNKNGYGLEINYYGLNQKEKVSSGNNLGILTKKELEKLYQNSDFGLVASMTNISLVPYEMLATGLPVIEFVDGSYSEFLGSDTAFLVDFDYHMIVNSLMNAINNPNVLEKMHKNALVELNKLSWDASCEEFLNIINGIKKHE